MKIYMIGQKGIPAVSGGVEKHVDDLAFSLARKGHKVFVYTRRNYTNKNLKSYRGVNLISKKNIPTKHLDAISHTFSACLDAAKRDADIIHFHSIGPSSLIWLMKILKPKTPVVATFHTRCYLHKKWNFLAKLYLRFGEFIACKLADKTVAVSKGLADYARKTYGREAVYAPSGVFIEEKILAEKIKKWGLERENYILSVSRLISLKGVHYLIEAYKKIKTDKKLVITGDGFFTDNYVKYLKELAVGSKNIIFTGRQSGQVLQELYSNACFFVGPSESEGLSISLLEAMSFGLPVLTSDIPENKEAIGESGFTFKNKDIGDLRDKMEYVLAHGDLAKKKGLEAKDRAARVYNWGNIAEKVLSVYNEAIQIKQALKRKAEVKVFQKPRG